MQTYFYNLAGGINQAASKMALGLDTKKLYWTDSKNIEILQNNGIIRQNGNVEVASLEEPDEIIGLHPLKDDVTYNILIATKSGKLFVYETKSQTLVQLEKTIDGSERINFVDFLDGVVVGGKNTPLFYMNNDDGYPIEECNLKDSNSKDILADIICVYAGRIWVAAGSTLFYSALGTYDDFESENDAGYINNFHTDTNDITALKTYKEYLAIYKESSVYLLSGTNNKDFSVTPFADKGTSSFSGVANINNKQYFINEGVFSLEQAGLLSQIQLGEEISLKIKPEFEKFDKTRMNEIIVIHYEAKNQVWYFIPYQNEKYFHTVWIYNYINDAWFKRVIPQNITTACLVNGNILTADASGKLYKEDFGSTFSGQPIEFLWKSPFLASGDSNIRKTVEEFYFMLDESYDNNFNFSVYKNYDSEYKDDEDSIHSTNLENLIWATEETSLENNFYWKIDSEDDAEILPEAVIYSVWATGSNSIYKAEISESNYSVQLCVEGNSINQGVAIIGLEFKEIYLDT